jgi:iron complex outermembrane receptor protein
LEDVLLYAAYRRGYKSGGFNLPAQLPQYRDFGKETVDDFEVGLKADWDIGVPLRTNIAVYYDKYKDIQISIPTVIAGVGLASLVQNVGKATNKGFEIETTLIPVKRLALTGFLSYLDSHSDVNLPGTPAIIGRQTAFQPKWKYGFGVNYSIPVRGDGVVALIADYSWQSAVNTNDFVSPIQTYPSYGLLNARIEWTNFLTKGVDLSVFGSNLTQKTYIQGGFALAPQLGFESDFYGEPRTYGVSLKVHFGEY